MKRTGNESDPALEVPNAAPDTKPEQLLTVSELAVKHGQTRKVREDLGDTPYTAEHLSAEVANGWARHAYFVGTEARLSDADYLAAIAAAKLGKAHGPADHHKNTPPFEAPPDPALRWKGAAQ